jgi:hypothetical protein
MSKLLHWLRNIWLVDYLGNIVKVGYIECLTICKWMGFS